MKESIIDIGLAIKSHIDKEKVNHTRIPAIGRALCSLNSTLRGREGAKQFWIVIGDNRKALQTDGQTVHRDSKMGGVLTRYISGTRSYDQNTINPRGVNHVEVTIHNRATYSPNFTTANELVIGTGKTTTMIQRLKFLISPIALEEQDAPLTQEQILSLTDVNVRDTKWLYFSPTEKLLSFLQANMRSEYLNANENNTTTLDNFRSNLEWECLDSIHKVQQKEYEAKEKVALEKYKAQEPGKHSPVSSSSSGGFSSNDDDEKESDNMRGFDPTSEDDMDDNGMSRYMENYDEEGWD